MRRVTLIHVFAAVAALAVAIIVAYVAQGLLTVDGETDQDIPDQAIPSRAVPKTIAAPPAHQLTPHA